MSTRLRNRKATMRPFLKWAGGKAQLMADYGPLFPTLAPLATYHEPFIGGGAVFLHLRNTSSVTGRAVLSDLNEHLITTWTAVRDQPLLLAERLRALEANHSREEYYVQRDRYNTEKLSPLDRATILIYLNKAGFNGLYRVISKGFYNVPVGRPSQGGLFNQPSHLEREANAHLSPSCVGSVRE